jgi:hypothetical protein
MRQMHTSVSYFKCASKVQCHAAGAGCPATSVTAGSEWVLAPALPTPLLVAAVSMLTAVQVERCVHTPRIASVCVGGCELEDSSVCYRVYLEQVIIEATVEVSPARAAGHSCIISRRRHSTSMSRMWATRPTPGTSCPHSAVADVESLKARPSKQTTLSWHRAFRTCVRHISVGQRLLAPEDTPACFHAHTCQCRHSRREWG